jgi:hypothetical protein
MLRRRSGASGTRTHDLPAASRTLSQLSYSPEPVLACKVNAGTLCVSRWINPQANCASTRDDLNRYKERFIEIPAVDRDRINLVMGIRAPNVAGRRKTRATDTNADDSRCLVQRTPFALHAYDPLSQIEQQVIATMLRDRPEHVDTQLDRLQRDRRFGDVALLVGGQHLPILARPL